MGAPWLDPAQVTHLILGSSAVRLIGHPKLLMQSVPLDVPGWETYPYLRVETVFRARDNDIFRVWQSPLIAKHLFRVGDAPYEYSFGEGAAMEPSSEAFLDPEKGVSVLEHPGWRYCKVSSADRDRIHVTYAPWGQRRREQDAEMRLVGFAPGMDPTWGDVEGRVLSRADRKSPWRNPGQQDLGL